LNCAAKLVAKRFAAAVIPGLLRLTEARSRSAGLRPAALNCEDEPRAVAKLNRIMDGPSKLLAATCALWYSGSMKTPHNFPLVLSTFGLCFSAAASVTAADSPGLDALQGTWSTKRTNQEGVVISQTLEFKQDRMTFKMTGPDGELRFFAKGVTAVQKLGPFQTLRMTGLQAGRSEDSAESVEDERTSVFVLDGDTLTLASNFDKARSGQPPRADTYSRGKAAEKTGTKLAGTWKMDVHIGENDSDYELRFSESDGKLSATLISPRSGEHKFRVVAWADERLTMELDRDYDGNAITLIYTGKLEADGLSGKVVAKGAEDQFSGTWKARK
jgi:hypothetical protein